VCETEIESIQQIVLSRLPAAPHTYFTAGQTVRISEGPLAGVEGRIISLDNGHQLIVSVTLLQRSVSVRIDSRWVRPASA
jgi:transcription antitermination factor NusG